MCYKHVQLRANEKLRHGARHAIPTVITLYDHGKLDLERQRHVPEKTK
jgi:hypothetical protein